MGSGNGMAMNMGDSSGMNFGAPNMAMNGMGGFGGMNMSPPGQIHTNGPATTQYMQQQQQPSNPIMYDSIKNLLEKKPVPVQAVDSGVDPFSCFTGTPKDGASSRTSSRTGSAGLTTQPSNTGSFTSTFTPVGTGNESQFGSNRTNSDSKNNTPAQSFDPFSGGSGTSNSNLGDLSILSSSNHTSSSGKNNLATQSFDPFSSGGNGGMNAGVGDVNTLSSSNIMTSTPSSSGTPKNNALADRLRAGKRQTQEAQRAQLNVGTYTNSGASSGGKQFSIKQQLGSSSTEKVAVSNTNSAPTFVDLGF